LDGIALIGNKVQYGRLYIGSSRKARNRENSSRRDGAVHLSVKTVLSRTKLLVRSSLVRAENRGEMVEELENGKIVRTSFEGFEIADSTGTGVRKKPARIVAKRKTRNP